MALIDKASLLFVPSVVAEGKAFNILPSGNRAPDSTDQNSGYDQTRADFDFDRGSNAAASRINSSGLIEKYRENLLLQSNSFDVSANWVNNSSTESSGFEGYDGTSDAWKLTATATSGVFIRQIISFSNIKTFSVYAKAGTSSHLLMLTEGGGNTWFDLQNGIIETDAAIISKMESVGNDWYRCSVTWNSSITGVRLYVCDADGTSSVANGGNIYIQSAQLESGLVATEVLTSGATTGKAGVLVDLPRINYDANGENGSLLLEPSRQNVMPYSEYFEAWDTTGSITLTTNYGISPEGLKNSTRVQFSGASQELKDATSVVAGNVASIYIKGTDGETIKFGSALAEEIMTLNGEWQRLETYNAAATNKITINTYSGATARDIEIYGAMLEAGSYASSYIPTMGTTETRAADVCSVTGVSDVIGQSEGTIFIETFSNDVQDGDMRIQLSSGTSTSNWMFLSCPEPSGGGVKPRVFINNAGSVQVNSYGSSLSSGNHKYALAYKENDVVLYVDGVLQISDTSASIPTCDKLTISGNLPTNNNTTQRLNKHKQVALFKERLSNAELATLTTL